MLAPLQLLHRELRHWLPMVVVLSMLSVVPETLLATVVPDPLAMVSGGADLDPEVMLSALAAFLGVAAAKMLVQLVTLMIAFVVLADLTAGRAPNVWAGLARLGSWRLQGAWIVAGMFEQIAISLWFLGGGAVLIPLGLVTTAAYEEASGFAAFTRSNELGRLHVSSGTFGPAGTRLAVGVTLAFALWFLCDSLIGLASCAGSIFSMSSALEGRSVESILAGTGAPVLPAHTGFDVAMDLLLAPLALMPTIYMMTLQQITYWQARTVADGEAPGILH